jgi:hypothetical protein
MKRIALLLWTIIFGFSLYGQTEVAQDTLLPEKVLKTFQKKCPKASSDDWMKEGDHYVISYFDDNDWYDVRISAKGKWQGTAIMIDYEKLPQAIISHFEASKYNEFEVVKITLAEKPKLPKEYRIYVESLDMKETVLVYGEDGHLIAAQ